MVFFVSYFKIKCFSWLVPNDLHAAARSLFCVAQLYIILSFRLFSSLQPPPSPDNEWDSEEEDGIADQQPLDISS